jgi:DNA-binding MarR family transcriptional regulator
MAKTRARTLEPPAAADADASQEPRKSPDLTFLDNLVGYQLRRAHGLQIQRFTSVFGPLNIRPVQLSILGLIHYNPGLRQSELGRALDIKRANIVTLLDELEQRKLVTREPAHADRRSHVLRLTAQGRQLTAKLLNLHERLERNLAESLGVRQRDQLMKLLKSYRALNPAPELDDENPPQK